MASNTYFFDVIITRLEANQEFIEPKCLTIDVLFHKLSMRLTSTHINVECFTDEPVCVFQTGLDELKYMVAQVPVLFIVNYKDENIGLCETVWPCDKEDNVHSCMDEIFHIGKCDIISDGKQTGVLEYVMRIKRKLDEPEKQWSALQLNSNLKKLLNPCDSDFNNPVHDESLKQNENEVLYSFKNGGDTISRTSDTTDILKDVSDIEHTNNTFDVSEPVPFNNSWYCKENRHFIEQMNEARYSGPKVCPICKHSLRWLPKFSPCPNCGFKQVPITISSEKKPLVTEEILEKYAEASTDSDMNPLKICSLNEKNPRPKGRCICGGKGTCAYCRVHSLVDNLVRESKVKGSNVHNEFQCDKDDNKLFNICKTKSHPSFLAKVVSEMCMLLDVKKPSKLKRIGVSKKCEEMIQAAILKTKVAKKSAQKHRMKIETKSKPNKSRKIIQPVEQVKKMVPSHMGYLWTKSQLGKRKPGYIDKDVRRIMHYFLNVHETLTPEARLLTMKHIAKICKENEIIKPTLKVIKKDHAYFVSLNSNSKIPSKSITFKIGKYPYLEEYSKMKRILKEKGFKKCVCHKPVADCICRDYQERKALKKEVIEYCWQRNMPDCHEDFVLSDTSISEADLELDVTAPAACVRSTPIKKPKLCLNQGSQYNKSDLNPPKALKKGKTAYKFYNTYDCAVGKKYGEQVYVPQPGEVLPATEWLEYIRLQKKGAKAAKKPKPLKPGQIERLKPKPVEEVGPPFNENGPPKVARDGTALDENDKPLLDAQGNAYQVEKTMDGRLKVKPKKKELNMIKYLTKKGLIVEKQKGRNPPKVPPGGINPEYLEMERELKRKRYCELLQQPPGILVDRVCRIEPCCGCGGHIC